VRFGRYRELGYFQIVATLIEVLVSARGRICLYLGAKLIFKLEEEGNTTLLLHLLQLYAETAIFGSASDLGCRLVVKTVQPTYLAKATSTSTSQSDQAMRYPVISD
jgi:hypothetical protein